MKNMGLEKYEVAKQGKKNEWFMGMKYGKQMLWSEIKGKQP